MPLSRWGDQFRQRPLEYLDRAVQTGGDIIQTGDGEYCLADPVAAKSVLRNASGLYRDHSDFFSTRQGLFGPRSEQLKIARGARALLRGYLRRQSPDSLSAFIVSSLPARSAWPDTGNRLVYGYLRTVLLSSDASPELRQLLDDIVDGAVLASARSSRPMWKRMALQFRTTWMLSRQMEQRRAHVLGPHYDLLDVVARSAPADAQAETLAEIYLSFVFAIAGSLGFLLGWSAYLLAGSGTRDARPAWVVQEALRLWPVAWMLGRHPAMQHVLSGVDVGVDNVIVACPYLVHRNPRYWDDPARFRPDRWAAPASWRNPAFIPFGHGPHRCVAADLAIAFVADILAVLMRSSALSITVTDQHPSLGAALAPPRFELAW